MTAHAELRGFAKATALLAVSFGGLVGLLYVLGLNWRSYRIWFPIAVTFGSIFLGFVWRLFWRLRVEDGTLIWRMLTRSYALPLNAIRAIDARVITGSRQASHVIVVRGANDRTIDLEVATWKEDELKAVLREVRARSNPMIAPAVEGWLG